MTDTTPIRVDGVTKRYDDFVAVNNLSFSVPGGGVFGLLGPNGAGKTTTIRMIMNITMPDSGSISIMGEPSTGGNARRIGYLPEERGLYKKMRVLKHLIFLGEIRGLTSGEAKTRSIAWLQKLGLADWSDKKVEELSKGMQQKIQFIGSVLHDPDVMILDEPFSGLDPVNARVLKDQVQEFKERGKTVVLSTHVMEQAEQLCDEIALINRSRLVLQGRVDEIKRRYSGSRLTLKIDGSSDALGTIAGVTSAVASGDSVEVVLEPTMSTPEFLRKATAVCNVASAVPYEVSLEDVFVTVVGEDAAAEVTR